MAANKAELVAEQLLGAELTKKSWGTAMYNVLVEGLLGGGVINDTPKLQALINKAITEGRKAVFFPHGINGQYYVTALTNADQVMFFGDNAKFVGGYTGKINQIGFTPSADGMWVNVKDYNAKGEGLANDDTQAFIDALTALVAAGGGKLVIPATSSFYNVTNSIIATLPDGVFIEIEGIGMPEIRLTSNTETVHIFNFLSSSGAPSNGVYIHGVRINGVGAPEQWGETVYENLKLALAINAEVGNVIIRDCIIENCYGIGIRIVKYNKVTLDNIEMSSVGGKWYLSDTHDAFGDAIYLGYAQSYKSLVSINDCSLIGYPADRPRLSRIGITIEYGGSKVSGSGNHIEGYDRIIHIEGAEETEADFSDMTVERFTVGLFLYGGAKSINFDNVRFRDNIAGLWASSGMIGTFEIATQPDYVRFSKCSFDIAVDCKSNLDVLTSFQNCKFTNAGGRWEVDVAHIKSIDNCTIEGECFYFYLPEIEFITNTIIKGQIVGGGAVSPIVTTGGYIRKFSNCRLEDAIIIMDGSPDFAFEFDSCRFVRTGTTVYKDRSGFAYNGFTRPYATTIAIRDCIRQADAAYVYVDASFGAPERLLGTNNTIFGGVWA